MRTIDCPLEIKELSETGTFEGLASVYGNIDLGGDICEPGCFKEFKTTRDGHIRILDGHDTRRPIGKGIITDTHVGLAIKGKLNLAVARAREVYELMKDGIIDGLSVGYDVIRPGGDEYREDGVRILKKLRLWEVSTTPFPMNEMAKVGGVKSVPKFATIREAEEWVRDELGFSHRKTREFVESLKQVLLGTRDESARDEPRQDDLKAVLQFLKTVAK